MRAITSRLGVTAYPPRMSRGWRLGIAVGAVASMVSMGVLGARAIMIDIYAARLASVPTPPPTPPAPKPPEQPLDKWLRLVARDNDPATVVWLGRRLFDFSELTRRALAEHGAELSPTQRDELTRGFQVLIERRANWLGLPRRIVQVKRAEQQLTGVDALVLYDVRAHDDLGRITDVEMRIRWHLVDGDWRAWDVVTDDASLMRSYKRELHRLISEDGVEALMDKVRQKLKGA